MEMDWRWVIGLVIGGGGMMEFIRFMGRQLGVYQTARTRFRDDLLERLSELENQQRTLKEKVESLRHRAQRAELRNVLFARQLEQLLQDHNRLRKESGMDPLDDEVWHPPGVDMDEIDEQNPLT